MKKIVIILLAALLAVSCGKPFFKSLEERRGSNGDVVMVQPDEAVRYENVYEYIKAKFPSISVTKDGGTSYLIRIRGVNTITGPLSPVLILDGMEVRDFDGVNTVDVEKIEIVKGPRAFSLGTNGTNGAVVITTRKAR